MTDTAVAERIEATPFQQTVMALPESFDLFLGGGRGGGKTYALMLLILRHVEQHRHNARVLVVRRNFPDLRDFEAEARYLFGTVYGRALQYNLQSHLFRIPNRATVQLDQIESEADFVKYQGKSFSLIVVDEAGQFPDPAPLDLLRSSLRSRAGVPCRMVLSANPGGSGHGWLHLRHVAGVAPWRPYVERRTGRTFVTCPSTLEDNPHLGAEYRSQIEAATATDPALQKAWLFGDWSIARGAYFAAVFDTQRNVIDAWTDLPTAGRLPKWQADLLGERRNGWDCFVAGDHGSAAPAVFYLVARSPGAEGPDGRWYPRDSLVLFDEIAFVEKDSLSKGLGMTVPAMAAEVVAACKSWGMPARGVLDDACFSAHGAASGTLADEYRKAGLHVHRAEKGDRLGGWQRMRRLLADAGKPDVAGLYVSERCTYWLSTVPFLDRDPRKPEDVDTRGPDHPADATRYACIQESKKITTKPFRWV